MLTLCVLAYTLFLRQCHSYELHWALVATGLALGVGAGYLPWSKGTRLCSYAVLVEVAVLNFATFATSGPAGFSVHTLLGYIAGLVLSAVLLFPTAPGLAGTKQAVWERRFCAAFAILLICTPLWLVFVLAPPVSYSSRGFASVIPENPFILLLDTRLWMLLIPAWGLVLMWRCLVRGSGTVTVR